MNFKLFLMQLGGISVALLLIVLGFTRGDWNHTIFWLYLLGITCFVVFSLFIFFYGYSTSKSDVLFSFNNVVVASFMIKLLMSIGFLMAFEKFFNPFGDRHIFHYLLIYLIYTVYEVYFLTKLARSDDD